MRRGEFIFYVLFSSLFLLTRCESDYNLSIPDYGRAVVINGFLSSDDTISVQVYESKYILDSNYFYKPLKNPVVQLWIDNNYVEDLHCRYTWSPFSQYKIDSITYISTHKPVSNKIYSIKVIHENYAEATASVKMPDQIKIERIDSFSVINNTERQYSISFDDPSTTTNYYFLKFFLPHMSIDNSCDTTISNVENLFKVDFLYNESFIFADKQFNGKEAEVKYLIPSVIQDYVNSAPWNNCQNSITINKIVQRKMYIKLFNCSEEFYLYYKSYRAILERGDDIFFEPGKVFSNVHNGYGILAAYNSSVDSSQFVKIHSFSAGVH